MRAQAAHQQREINRLRRHLVKVGELPRLNLAAGRGKSVAAPDLATTSIGSFVCALAVPFPRPFPSSIEPMLRRCRSRWLIGDLPRSFSAIGVTMDRVSGRGVMRSAMPHRRVLSRTWLTARGGKGGAGPPVGGSTKSCDSQSRSELYVNYLGHARRFEEGLLGQRCGKYGEVSTFDTATNDRAFVAGERVSPRIMLRRTARPRGVGIIAHPCQYVTA